MARPRKHLFLPRPSYRRRRLRDAARLLPVFGVLLVTLPMLWTAPGDAALGVGRDTGRDLVYFFGLWLLLVGCAAAFAPGLSAGSTQGDDPEDDD